MKELTPEELASSDGKDGKPALVAHQGKVYDVSGSRLWNRGLHMNRHASGRDLSSDILGAPHGPEVLERYPQVGTIRGGGLEELNHLPSFIQNLLQQFPMARRHPHPVLVHFPIAFLIGSSLFVLLHLLWPNPHFEMTGFYLLILGALASPFGMASGLFTWWVNYRLKPSRIIKRKIQLSALLLVFEIILVYWRSCRPDLSSPVYILMMLLLTPIVFLLGYYGGQMTFPVER